MNVSVYLVVSGCIFGIVAIFHLLRAVNDWVLVLGPWSTPMWVSWIGTIIPLVLCVTAFRLLSGSSQ